MRRAITLTRRPEHKAEIVAMRARAVKVVGDILATRVANGVMV